MKRDLINPKPLTSSFLSCEKDTEIILRKLFVESQPHSDILKRLLVVQNADCLDNLNHDISAYKLQKLMEEKYITLDPLVKLPEHEQVKSFIVLHFDNFTQNATNTEFRDSLICFDIVCHHDHWFLGNYRQRPFKILGIIDGIMNRSRLSGIGQLNFVGCSREILNENWSSFSLTYLAIHGSDDRIEVKDDK